ncbi:MAG: gamma-glutamyltransferase [Betaproteobacteria bacterium]|nr:gamma-glutamyltransferase [Betaproteobacteria bacterium]
MLKRGQITRFSGSKRIVLAIVFSAFASGCSSNDDFLACQQAVSTGSVVVGSGLAGDPAIPEPQSGYKLGKKKSVTGLSYMAVTANPLATKAGCEVLRDGGSAMDAAVAIQMVLGLVEPQSSGLGGGAFMLHYDAASKKVQSYDGRETAPSAATEDYLRYISATDKSNPLPKLSNAFNSTRASGRSIGTPGAVRMLELAHKDYGKRSWGELFNPAIQLASEGFPISGRMAAAIAGARADLLRDPDAVGYFLNADLSPKALGTTIKNPDYAATLKTIASGGADAFYTGPIAKSIVDKIAASTGGPASPVEITPGLTSLQDLANYKAIRREPVCTTYRNTWVCGMGPPSSGGVAVAQALGILEQFDLSAQKPTQIGDEGAKPSVAAVHLISEAQRLAYADRNQYLADTDFFPLPANGVSSLVDKAYLKTRASLISLTKSMGTATAGTFTAKPMGSSSQEGNGTSHVTIVDRAGNVVSMTTTIESGMGSFHFTRGFLLNNQLTDFSFDPVDASGAMIANKIGPNKRPRSSMAPTIVFSKAADGSMGDFLMATGSPGGASIIQFVTKTLIGVIDWKLDAQQASAMVNFGAANSPTTGVGGEHPYIDSSANGLNDPLLNGLRALGHTVSFAAQSSGVSTIVKTIIPGRASPVYVGGADPRREGIALGDSPL